MHCYFMAMHTIDMEVSRGGDIDYVLVGNNLPVTLPNLDHHKHTWNRMLQS